jgi:biopolymer transport protein ExbB/TolQ
VEDVVTTAVPQEYTVWGLVMMADPVVKGVMILLVLMSVMCWAIIFEKVVRISRVSVAIRRLERARPGQTERGIAGEVLQAGYDELRATHDQPGLERRALIEASMRRELKYQLHRQEKGLPFLATTGSAAPFIGLFGTVWGIVNSFTAIATQKDTSLAVVAPGIAEALIATALGLAAAIPAVVAYNQIAVALGRRFARGAEAINKFSTALMIADFGEAPQAERSAQRGRAPEARGGKVQPIHATGKHV